MSTTDSTRRALAPFVAAVISIGWLFSLGVGAVQQNWEPLTITTPVMLGLAGYAFGISIIRQAPTRSGDDE